MSNSEEKKEIKALLGLIVDARTKFFKESKERSLQLAKYLEKLKVEIPKDQLLSETLEMLTNLANEEYAKINLILNNLLVRSDEIEEVETKIAVEKDAILHKKRIVYAKRAAYAIFAQKARAYLRNDTNPEQARDDLVLAKKAYKQISLISRQAANIIKKLKQELSELKPLNPEALNLNFVDDLDDVSSAESENNVTFSPTTTANLLGGSVNTAGLSVIASAPLSPLFSKPVSTSPTFRQRFSNKVSPGPQRASLYLVK